MVNKKFVVFAIGSMFVAGATLASNVNFGQRAFRWASANLDFVGPISGLVNAVVKPNDFQRQRPILSFQVDEPRSTNSIGSNTAFEVAAYDSRLGGKRNSTFARDEQGSGKPEGAKERRDPNGVIASGAAGVFTNTVGSNNSRINSLAADFLKNGSNGVDKDISAILNSRGVFSGELTVIAPIGAGTAIADSAADIPMILAAATNGEPLVTAAVTGAPGQNSVNNTPGTTTNTTQNGTTTTTTTTTVAPNKPAVVVTVAKVPLPGALGLMGLGLIALVSVTRRSNKTIA